MSSDSWSSLHQSDRAAALAARGGGASLLTMPKRRVGNIDIFYEIHGDGPQTLVMVRGLESNLCARQKKSPVLERHFRLVAFDQRGAAGGFIHLASLL